MSSRETAELLLLVGRLVQAESYDGKLSPTQWMALRFFARANQFSRTPWAFTEFQATTRGIASSGAHRRFGIRQDCTCSGGEMWCNLTSASSSAAEGLLLGVPIQPEDAGLLCVHFQPTSEPGMADTVNEFTTAICRKEGAVETDAMLVDSNLVAFEQTIDFKRGHREPSACGVPTTRSR
jgi:hypothetical protein